VARDSLTCYEDFSEIKSDVTEDGAREVRPAGAHQTSYADNLTAPKREGDVVQETLLGEPRTSSTVSRIGATSFRNRSLISRPIIMPMTSR